MHDTRYIDRYLPFLQSLLTPSRLQHSMGVMRVMADLAELYNLDREQAVVTGLLHDAARDLPADRQMALIREGGIELADPCEEHPVYLHALAGAYLIAKELGITEPNVLDAISTHSYVGNGSNFHSCLSWCLRFADILAPSHEWKGMKKLKSVVYAGRKEESALLHCGWVIEYFREHDVPVHPNLQSCYRDMRRRVPVDEHFFDRW
ncbi:MAG: bis(5'-nucleosyl)-tetraphosphatase (symmetrical) YqeK [Anaerolineae bacterium]|nr:bis(5'-nucleosyl)-tetraphosphatase (symmetrical) YqeK [Anaerolineae bacterium]